MSPPALFSRSLSLPSPQEDIRRPSLTYPTRQPSQMVCLDTPITPPMSPPTLKKDIPNEDQHSNSKENARLQNVPDSMNVDTAHDVVLHRPERLLEDEIVHLQRSGIKLSDFEVRGTLGTWGLNLLALLAYSFSRDGDLWKSASRSPSEHSCTVDCTNTKPFRYESPSQN